MADIDTAAMREHYNAPAITGRATPDIEELCDEIDRLRARLAEVEAERDIGIAEVEAQRDKALADLTEMTAGYTTQMETISGLLPRLREIEARLAEVEAERDSARRTAETYLDKLAELDRALTAVDDVLLNVPAPSWLDEIAARGEGDRGA